MKIRHATLLVFLTLLSLIFQAGPAAGEILANEPFRLIYTHKGSPALILDKSVLYRSNGFLKAHDMDNDSVLWKIELPYYEGSDLHSWGGRLFRNSSEFVFQEISKDSGLPVTNAEYLLQRSTHRHKLNFMDGYAILWTPKTKRLTVYSLDTTQPLFYRTLWTEPTRLFVEGERLYFVSSGPPGSESRNANSLFCIQLPSGRLVYKYEAPDQGTFESVHLLSDGSITATGGGFVYHLDQQGNVISKETSSGNLPSFYLEDLGIAFRKEHHSGQEYLRVKDYLNPSTSWEVELPRPAPVEFLVLSNRLIGFDSGMTVWDLSNGELLHRENLHPSLALNRESYYSKNLNPFAVGDRIWAAFPVDPMISSEPTTVIQTFTRKDGIWIKSDRWRVSGYITYWYRQDNRLIIRTKKGALEIYEITE